MPDRGRQERRQQLRSARPLRLTRLGGAGSSGGDDTETHRSSSRPTRSCVKPSPVRPATRLVAPAITSAMRAMEPAARHPVRACAGDAGAVEWQRTLTGTLGRAGPAADMGHSGHSDHGTDSVTVERAAEILSRERHLNCRYWKVDRLDGRVYGCDLRCRGRLDCILNPEDVIQMAIDIETRKLNRCASRPDWPPPS